MKNIITKVICFSLLAIGGYTAQAQLSNSFKDVLSIKLESMGPIYENDVVKGYYMFYNLDKADRKNRSYLVKILDENTREVASNIITKPKNYTLIESAFNGEALLFTFLNRGKKLVELVTLDKEAKVLGSKIITDLKKWDIHYNNLTFINGADNLMYNPKIYMMDSYGAENKTFKTIFPVKGKGFIKIRNIMRSKKVSYDMEFIPNEIGKTKGWVNRPNSRTPMNHFVSVLNVGEKYAFLSTIQEKSFVDFKTELRSTVKMVNLETGRTVFQKRIADKRYNLSLINCFYDDEKKEVLVLGRYFSRKKIIMSGNNDLGEGMYALKLNMKGEVISRAFISWEEDMQKLIGMSPKGRIKGKKIRILVKKIINHPDGKMTLIANTTRFVLPSMAGGMTTLSSIGDADAFYFFEFNQDFSLENIFSWDFGKGSSTNNPDNVFLKKDLSAAKYRFTDQTENKKAFFSVYSAEERGNGKVLGIIAGTDGEYSEDKISLKTKASSISALPAKPGYVLLIEYFKKEKRLDMRLEKFNY